VGEGNSLRAGTGGSDEEKDRTSMSPMCVEAPRTKIFRDVAVSTRCSVGKAELTNSKKKVLGRCATFRGNTRHGASNRNQRNGAIYLGKREENAVGWSGVCHNHTCPGQTMQKRDRSLGGSHSVETLFWDSRSQSIYKAISDQWETLGGSLQNLSEKKTMFPALEGSFERRGEKLSGQDICEAAHCQSGKGTAGGCFPGKRQG